LLLKVLAGPQPFAERPDVGLEKGVGVIEKKGRHEVIAQGPGDVEHDQAGDGADGSEDCQSGGRGGADPQGGAHA